MSRRRIGRSTSFGGECVTGVRASLYFGELLQEKGTRRLFVTDMDDFMEQLASPNPVPGGGSVAALEVAMAAALLAMVANLTAGRKKYVDVEGRVIQIRDEALILLARASHLVHEDIEAYAAVSRVREMPRDTDEQKELRRASMQSTLKGAVEPPLQTMITASRSLDLAAELMMIGNKSAISDVGTAVGAARAGFEAALLNVEINLALIDDEPWTDGVRSMIEAFPSVPARSDEVARYVLAVIRN